MSSTVLIDSTNFFSQNQYRVNLSSTVDLNDYEVAVGQCFIYYSWYNINASPLNNNSYNITIPTSGTSDYLRVLIPDGGYNISDLNNQLQYFLIQGGYYITNNTTGLNTYYAAFAVNPTSYSVDFTTTPMPTSLPSGYTSGGMTFPGSANQHYQLEILSTNNFGNIVGYNAGTYPAVPTNAGIQTKSSDFTPNVNPISAVQMRLSCVYSPLSANSQLIHVFTNGGASIGELIDGSPNYEQFISCIGSHKELTLSFYDQNGAVLEILDRNLIVKLIFRKKINAKPLLN